MSRWRVVELAQGVAGPACGRLFAGLGHDVVKCEPREGDLQRRRAPFGEDGDSLAFSVLNGGKRSVCTDWSSAAGRELLHSLLASADVAIVGAHAADGGNIGGLDPEALHRDFPRLVVVSVSGFGLGSDLSALPDDSLLAEAYAGLATMIGLPERKPLSLGGEQSAHLASYAAFMGACLALRRRRRTGRGDLVDVAMCDVAAGMDWKSDVSYALFERVPRRGGDKLWKMLPAKDGWAGMIYLPPQWPKVVSLIGDKRLADPQLADEAHRLEATAEWLPIIEEWSRVRGKKEIYERAQEIGLPFGFAADIGDVAQSGQLQDRGFITRDDAGTLQIGPPWDRAELGWQAGPVPRLGEHTSEIEAQLPPAATASASDPDADPTTAPLDGIVVLDLGTITAGAAAGRLLADYGATVIKIESTDRPDGFRQWTAPGSATSSDPRSAADSSPLFEANNTGKLAIELDLKSEEGRATFYELAGRAHVVLENFRPGVTSRLGIDFEAIRAINPEIVYLSLSSQGSSGREAGYSSYGSTLDLLSGLAWMTGYDESRPIWSSSSVNYPDQIVALVGAALVVYCIESQTTGVLLDVSQLEVVAWALADQIAASILTGHTDGPAGNRRTTATPHDVYPCAGEEQWVAIACFADSERQALAALVGADFGSRDEAWWFEHADDVDQAVAAWTAQQPRATVANAFRQAGVPSCPVFDASDRATEPRFVERRVVIENPRNPELPCRGFPFVMRDYAPPPPSPAPFLGEHSAFVLHEFGLDADRQPVSSTVIRQQSRESNV